MKHLQQNLKCLKILNHFQILNLWTSIHYQDKDDNSEYRKDYTGDVNDPLFYKYANTIKKMIRESDEGKNKLLKILKKLFITKEIEVEEYDEDSDIENEEELNNEVEMISENTPYNAEQNQRKQ